jgi:hypothetical protein
MSPEWIPVSGPRTFSARYIASVTSTGRLAASQGSRVSADSVREHIRAVGGGSIGVTRVPRLRISRVQRLRRTVISTAEHQSPRVVLRRGALEGIPAKWPETAVSKHGAIQFRFPTMGHRGDALCEPSAKPLSLRTLRPSGDRKPGTRLKDWAEPLGVVHRRKQISDQLSP